jgi:hypothetical protein
MTERKRTYEPNTQATAIRRLSPINAPAKSETEPELARRDSPNRIQADLKIDLLTRLIEHLKTL